MKKLVAYFSATGITAGVASNLADAIGGDLFEIQPAERYSKEDLNWWEETSRSTLEMKDPNCRPAMERILEGMEEYDAVLVGFPIWWNVAPRIVNSFLESQDLKGKIVIPFMTSGGSGPEKVNASIAGSCHGAWLKEPALFQKDTPFGTLSAWADGVL